MRSCFLSSPYKNEFSFGTFCFYISSYQQTLQSHGIALGATPLLPDVEIKLPPLKGANLIDHFYEIACEQLLPYKELIESLANVDIAPMPTKWKMVEGWTRYDREGNTQSIPYPDEKALIFDIEVCMREGSAPTMACAVGPNYWYSWTSKSLITAKRSARRNRDENAPRVYRQDEMITMEPDDSIEPRIIVGHNVSFDRARIRNQYNLTATKTRFLDTMSMHTCVSGVTSYQRAMLKSSKEIEPSDEAWTSISSLNGLVDVFKLYCNEDTKNTISKEQRSIFVEGTLHDIQRDFQNLTTYCAKDVIATFKVFKVLYPMFCERFPHPATLAGMLELGMAYLPVNSNWLRYINESDLIYKDFDIESKYLLAKRANQACRLLHNEAYKKDLWLWDEDWSVQELALKKTSTKKKPKIQSNETPKSNDEFDRLDAKFKYLFDIAVDLPKRPPMLAGYPAWYRKLCLKRSDPNWTPGPNEIGTGMQIAPKLLSLCWEGYPLHFIREHGWGFLVPFNDKIDDNYRGSIPLAELIKKCPAKNSTSNSATLNESEHAFGKLSKDVEMELGRKDYYSKPKENPSEGRYKGTGVWCNTEIEESCWFFKLPHKNGTQYRVGNPLARDFLIKFSENVLAGDNITAERVIQIARMLSYWRNNRDRITSQIVVTTPTDNENESHNEITRTIDGMAAIIPQVVVSGTLTRRASEPTWMTASNAQAERIGSELRSMVQAPENYRIVGADVDSQELWIASVLGDASESGMHGATPLGWMTLNGTKSNGTDMHSVTAKAVGISRDHAKVLNYARIYGAGQQFATRLLKQFNPTFSDGEAKSKAMKMFALTKGKKLYYPMEEYLDQLENKGLTNYEAKIIALKYGKRLDEVFHKSKWYGGTESAMFNRLEEIAGSEKPATPFLQSRLSRALESQPGTEDRFLPTRINWVVQSGAVDFLHLMLVCMRWLMQDNIRFCLSFHDEVRYIVKEEHAYKAAVAMHLTNLLTRSFCVSR